MNDDSLIDIANITTGSNDINLRKFHVKSYGYEKIHMDKDLIKYKLFGTLIQENVSRSERTRVR